MNHIEQNSFFAFKCLVYDNFSLNCFLKKLRISRVKTIKSQLMESETKTRDAIVSAENNRSGFTLSGETNNELLKPANRKRIPTKYLCVFWPS